MSQEVELIDELARAYANKSEASRILSRIEGLPETKLKPFEGETPINFWRQVVTAFNNGIMVDGLKRLLDVVRADLPGNAFFSRFSHASLSRSVFVYCASPPNDATEVAWHGPNISGDLLERVWGYCDSGLASCPVDVVYEPGLSDHPQLTRALMRLGVHGGIRVLHVKDPSRWKKAIKEKLPGCIGFETKEDWIPIESEPSNTEWSVQLLKPGNWAPQSNGIVEGSSKLADALNHRMDQWTLARLSALLDSVVDGEAPNLLHMDIAEAFMEPIKRIWSDWKHQLIRDQSVHRFLRLMLATATSLETPASELRIGKRTTDSCLLQGTVFALAIAAATNKTTPSGGDRYNLLHEGVATHLLGLQLIDKRLLQDKFAEITWEGGLAFLANELGAVDDLNALTRRFSESDEPPVTVNRQDNSNVRLITRDRAFRFALKTGPSALEKYVRATLSAQESAAERRLKESSRVYMEPDDVN